MAPSPGYQESLSQPERPALLNGKFMVHDGGSFKSRAQCDVKNVVIPIMLADDGVGKYYLEGGEKAGDPLGAQRFCFRIGEDELRYNMVGTDGKLTYYLEGGKEAGVRLWAQRFCFRIGEGELRYNIVGTAGSGKLGRRGGGW